MSCQAGPGIEPGPSALKASALTIELTWQHESELTLLTIVYYLKNKHGKNALHRT